MKQFNSVKIPGAVRASPSPGGEGRGEGERFLQSHFRNRRGISDKTRFPPSLPRRLRPLAEPFSGNRCPIKNYFNHAGSFSSFQISGSFWRSRTTADLLPCTSTSAASARVL